MQDLCEENFKTLLKNAKENLNKWQDLPSSWRDDSTGNICISSP